MIDATPGPRRTGLVLGLVGIAAVLAVGGAATVQGFTAEVVDSSESMVFDAQVPRLTVDIGSGDVTVGRAEGDRVEVTRTVRSLASADPTFTETSTANGVALAADCGGALFGRCSVDYEVRVPDGFVLDLRASSGRVAANGVGVESATVRVSSGDVHLADLRGPVTLEVSSGEVTAERLDVPTFRASSSSGDLRLDFATAPSTVEVDVSTGEVEVALPAGGTYRVQAGTSSGEQSVSIPTDASASSTVRVQAGSGDVNVRPR
jgi:hypothetical protein